MGTRSYIGKQNQDGSIRAIYCHWDGYPDHVGKVLKKHYNKEDELDALLDLGDLSSLAPTLDESVAYARDRGATDVDATTLENELAFSCHALRCGAEYKYLYSRDGKWKIVR